MLVFVYGTLKKGYGNNALLQRGGAKFIHQALTLYPKFDLVNLGSFPGLITGNFFVCGELWEVNDAGLRGSLFGGVLKKP